MFTPIRFLQVSLLSLVLGGCASQQTAAGPDAAKPPAARPGPALASNSSPQAAAPLALPPAPAPIAAGHSSSSGGPLLEPDGSLTPDLKAFAGEVSSVRGVPLAHVESLLRTVSYDSTAARLMKPSGQRIRRSWTVYRQRFVEPIRIRAGQEFWTANRAFLDRTARQYGVPASIIVAIIGVETVYGRNTGNFRVLDALATLGFRYPDDTRPERSQLFRDQLADLIELDYRKVLDAHAATGSFAGAMGLPQFMPGSLARYAADGNGDGHIDLLNEYDAIASVARFLRLHGWVPGLPVFAPATLPSDPASLVKGGLTPTLSWAELAAQGAAAITPTGMPTPAWMRYKLGMVNLVDESRNRAEYRIGTPNFFAITHYNRSYFYATAVADLAAVLADAMGEEKP
ncbi:lytic murein transglycosylase B [Pusillimonas sp. TS35]|uniref:lytic murein transglycosylase B n=1 Tax=Paracandidimonas lactea TaxID=2895524 RepID=UPI00136875F7|nr:lytic murein transglycosylase B [Paracandidimonas lactea]MYN11854.1 lytic murein transglycosylase B [Pusillimonas sp. TS35]